MQILIATSVVIFIVIGLSGRNKSSQTLEGFSLKRGKLSSFVVACGVSMTFVGGAALIGMSSLAYSFGWWALIDPIAVFCGIVISYFLVSKYRTDQGITMSNILSTGDKNLKLFIGFVTAIIFTYVTAAQFLAFSKLIVPFFPNVPVVLLITVPGIIILCYVLVGGFNAVTKTDVFQLLCVLILLLVPALIYFFSNVDSVQNAKVFTEFKSMPLSMMFYFFISILYVPLSQDINLRVKSALDTASAKNGLLLGGIFYFLAVGTAIFMGVTLAKNGIVLSSSENVITTFFNTYLSNQLLGGLAVVAILAAIWSTLDTYLVNTISAVSNDIFKDLTFFRNRGEKFLILTASVIVFIVSLVLALAYSQVLKLVFMALLLYVSILLPIALAKKLLVPEKIILRVSILNIVFFSLDQYYGFVPDYQVLVYPLIGVSLVLVAKFFKPSPPAK